MKAHRGLLACVAAGALAGTATGAAPVPGLQAVVPQQARPSEPAASGGVLPALRLHRYKMNGRVRPLLFWIGRDDIGIGEIVWRGAEGAVAYELLIGTDAAKAPRGINRWGYILEDTRPSGTRVFGVMTTSDEATISEVTRKAPGAQPVGRFKGIDARIAAGVSRSATETIETERDFRIRDREEVVGRIERRLKDAATLEIPVPNGVRPGFLIAVAELVNDTIAARKNGEQALRRMKGRTIAYVYGRRLYDIKIAGVGSIRPPADAPDRAALVRTAFETLNRETGSHQTFELEYAGTGPLAGVPTLIRHRPRWWLEAVLVLEEDSSLPGGVTDGRSAVTPRDGR
jgi:hypothetical protein